jgi:hypothetical protein
VVDAYVKHDFARRRAVREKWAYAHTTYLVKVARAAHALAGIMLDADMKQGACRVPHYSIAGACGTVA